MIYRISHPTKIIKASLRLPASKSLSNRVLIIHALTQSPFKIKNLSKANDTILLKKLLASQDVEINCEDAGTALRFLTAYYALTGKEKIITGSDRMKQRPVGELVKSLRILGARIDYLEKDGFPPFKITKSKLKGGKIITDSSISSQFISALLMIAPCLPEGLEIELAGETASKPYIQMTLSLMVHFGIDAKAKGNTITVLAGNYKGSDYTCESDWSAASYWYEIAALADEAEIIFEDMNETSLQGDAIIKTLMTEFGVHTHRLKNKLQLIKNSGTICSNFEYNFKDCPDLAQTMACTCAGLQVAADLKGLQNLRIKESNRAEALQRELYNLHIQTDFCDFSKLKIYNKRPIRYLNRPLKTHHDHRMAMSLAPLALKLPFIEIKNPEVVKKSYPGFWNDLKKAGFEIETI